MIRPGSLPRVTAIAVLAWTAAMAGFLAWDMHVSLEHARELAKNEARSHFRMDQAIRYWVTSHGGVYVPIDDRTPPNPALSHIPERDITTPSGKKLTLMNPAYVMRQMMGEFGDMYGLKGKITSLKLINPKNAPDEWEVAALHEFERGKQEVSEFAEIGGQPYLRLIGVLKIEPGCLKCHGFQGYKVGDVRGGIGIAVPMQPYLDEARTRLREILLPACAIWLLGLMAIAVLVVQARRREAMQERAEAELELKNADIHRANADLTRFAEVSAHHLMEPVRRLTSYAQRLHARLNALPGQAEDKEIADSLNTIERDAAYLRGLVRDIQLYLAAGEPRGEIKAQDVNEVLATLKVRLAPRLAAAGASIEAGPLPFAVLDRPRLSDLLFLLLDNALQHGQPGDPAIPLLIQVGGERDGALSRYFVCDNGPGIPSQYLERVFEIFERLAPRGGESGSGIGLSIARRIVESRNGNIRIENLPHGGAMVVFEIPDGESHAE